MGHLSSNLTKGFLGPVFAKFATERELVGLRKPLNIDVARDYEFAVSGLPPKS